MASIESNYEVNIARATGHHSFYDGKSHPRYEHFARVELGSISPAEAVKRANEIARRFAGPEWQLSMTYWKCEGSRTALVNPAPRDGLPGLWEQDQNPN